MKPVLAGWPWRVLPRWQDRPAERHDDHSHGAVVSRGGDLRRAEPAAVSEREPGGDLGGDRAGAAVRQHRALRAGERADLDGHNRKTIVAQGGTFTPKQLQLEKNSGKLYWCDREGMRLMRANLDGSNIEILVDTSQGDPRPGPDLRKWCVGIALDVEGGKFYWTQKGSDNSGTGRISRANTETPTGQTPANRQDIELLYDGLPEPIDLDIDPTTRTLYWTDRGNPPRGNTVNRASVDAKPQAPEILIRHLMEGIGIALDVPGDRMFVTDFAGSVYSAKLDGSGERNFLFAQGNLTGIAYTEI